jgi:succinate-semialdehyde dehydrogenase / glutarate-semialdehyde dehydrogenase
MVALLLLSACRPRRYELVRHPDLRMDVALARCRSKHWRGLRRMLSINVAGVQKVERHIADALAGGAQIAVGGCRPNGQGNFFQPTVLLNVASQALLCREETFGPVAGLVRVFSDNEAVQLANASRAGLAAYLFTSDFARAHRLSETLESGMVGLNTGLISTEVAPFGGCKESGIGREGSKYGLGEFEELRTVIAYLNTEAMY